MDEEIKSDGGGFLATEINPNKHNLLTVREPVMHRLTFNAMS
jgi:hypothetical protein